MKIYALMWGELVLYVGKTNASLYQRAASHRTPSNKSSSKYIPEYMDWEIVLVDEVPDEDGAKWEQYYYDELTPLYNHQRPGQTLLEYNRSKGYATQKAWAKNTGYAYVKEYNKSDKHKEYLRAYYQANKDAYAERQRKRRANR